MGSDLIEQHWRSSEVMGDIDLLPEHARDVVVRHLEALESAAEKSTLPRLSHGCLTQTQKNLRRRLPHAIKAQLRHRIARRSRHKMLGGRSRTLTPYRLCWLRAHQ
eukprot:763937-Hanusia_phi.AAC.7